MQRGFWMWAMSGFQRMPHHWEVDEYDPRWISDMQLAQQLYSFQKNDSVAQTMGESLRRNHKPESLGSRILNAGKRLIGIENG